MTMIDLQEEAPFARFLILVLEAPMKVRWLILLAFALLGADTPQEAVKQEVEKLKGTWMLVSMEVNGQEVPGKDLRYTFTEGKFSYQDGNKKPKEGSYVLNPAKDPRTIDLSVKGERAGLAIYKVDKDTLTLCVATPGKGRPKEFATKDAPGALLLVFKRANP
jgi:uncharacterized protein (TIGR03067 family)